MLIKVSKYLKKPWGTHKESFNPLSRIETKEDKDILKQIHLNLQLNSKIIPCKVYNSFIFES